MIKVGDSICFESNSFQKETIKEKKAFYVEKHRINFSVKDEEYEKVIVPLSKTEMDYYKRGNRYAIVVIVNLYDIMVKTIHGKIIKARKVESLPPNVKNITEEVDSLQERFKRLEYD